MNVGEAEYRSGRFGEIDFGDLELSDRSDLRGLGVSQIGEHEQDLGGGSLALGIESCFCFISFACGFARDMSRLNSTPVLLDSIDRVMHLLFDRNGLLLLTNLQQPVIQLRLSDASLSTDVAREWNLQRQAN